MSDLKNFQSMLDNANIDYRILDDLLNENAIRLVIQHVVIGIGGIMHNQVDCIFDFDKYTGNLISVR